jgi:hypothetical protein
VYQTPKCYHRKKYKVIGHGRYYCEMGRYTKPFFFTSKFGLPQRDGKLSSTAVGSYVLEIDYLPLQRQKILPRVRQKSPYVPNVGYAS